jgi:hypothetical protein
VATAAARAVRPESDAWLTADGRRWLPVLDSQRPHVRLGVLWFLVELAALVAGSFSLVLLAVPYAATAAIGAMQVARAWRRVGYRPKMVVAALCAAAMPVAAGAAEYGLGVAVLAATAASVLVTGGGMLLLLRDAGCLVRSWLFVGLAAASVVGIARVDLGAAVALVLLWAAYDCGDYLMGADARWPAIGTLGGMAAAGVVTFWLYVLAFPPFGGAEVLVYAVPFVVLAPLGQVAASMVLPDGRALASGLRRFDAVLLAGPVWMALLEVRPPA